MTTSCIVHRVIEYTCDWCGGTAQVTESPLCPPPMPDVPKYWSGLWFRPLTQPTVERHLCERCGRRAQDALKTEMRLIRQE